MQRESVRPPRQSDRTADPEGNKKKKKNLLLALETAGASLCIHAWSAAESIYIHPRLSCTYIPPLLAKEEEEEEDC